MRREGGSGKEREEGREGGREGGGGGGGVRGVCAVNFIHM